MNKNKIIKKINNKNENVTTTTISTSTTNHNSNNNNILQKMKKNCKLSYLLLEYTVRI